MCIDSQAQPTWQYKFTASDKSETPGDTQRLFNASDRVQIFYDPFNNWNFWTTDLGWGITNIDYVSPSQSAVVLSHYMIVNETITLKDPINLTGKNGTNLAFNMRMITSGKQWFGVEASRDGVRWDSIGHMSGDSHGWTKVGYSITDYDNSPYLKIKFRLASDGSMSSSAVYIDDVTISAFDHPV